MTSEDKCIILTMGFEGGSYGSLAGNFDGAGLSYGAIQFNFGMGTLQNLLREFYKNGPQVFEKCCTVNGLNYSPALLKVIELGQPISKAVEWSKTIQSNKNVINPVWKQIFKNFTGNMVFVHIQQKFIKERYMVRAKSDMKFFGFNSERALALFFDIAIQNGGVGAKHRLLIDKTKTGKELLKEIAVAVSKCSRRKYQKDVLDRKMCIVNGFGKVHGHDYNLWRDFNITDEKVVEG